MWVLNKACLLPHIDLFIDSWRPCHSYLRDHLRLLFTGVTCYGIILYRRRKALCPYVLIQFLVVTRSIDLILSRQSRDSGWTPMLRRPKPTQKHQAQPRHLTTPRSPKNTRNMLNIQTSTRNSKSSKSPQKRNNLNGGKSSEVKSLFHSPELLYLLQHLYAGITDIQVWLSGMGYFGLLVSLYSYSLFLWVIYRAVSYMCCLTIYLQPYYRCWSRIFRVFRSTSYRWVNPPKATMRTRRLSVPCGYFFSAKVIDMFLFYSSTVCSCRSPYKY